MSCTSNSPGARALPRPALPRRPPLGPPAAAPPPLRSCGRTARRPTGMGGVKPVTDAGAATCASSPHVKGCRYRRHTKSHSRQPMRRHCPRRQAYLCCHCNSPQLSAAGPRPAKARAPCWQIGGAARHWRAEEAATWPAGVASSTAGCANALEERRERPSWLFWWPDARAARPPRCLRSAAGLHCTVAINRK